MEDDIVTPSRLTAQEFIEVLLTGKCDKYRASSNFDYDVIIDDVIVEQPITLSHELAHSICIAGGTFQSDFIINGAIFQSEFVIKGGKFQSDFVIRKGEFQSIFKISGGKFSSDFVIRKGEFQSSFEISGGKFKSYFSLSGGDFQSDFLISGGKFKSDVTIWGGNFKAKFNISGGKYKSGLEISGGKFKSYFEISGGVYQSDFVINGGEFQSYVEISNGEFQSSVTISNGEFHAGFIISNGEFQSRVLFLDGRFKSYVTINGGLFNSNFEIWGGRYKSYFWISGGRFSSNLSILGGAFKSRLSIRGAVYIDSLSISSFDVFDSINISSNDNQVPQINELELSEISETRIKISNIQLRVLRLSQFYNEGSLKLINIDPISVDLNNSEIAIKDSSLGETEFIGCDWEDWTMIIDNSKIIDIFYTDTTFPEAITSSEPNLKRNFEQIRGNYGQLMTVAERQSDTPLLINLEAKATEQTYEIKKLDLIIDNIPYEQVSLKHGVVQWLDHLMTNAWIWTKEYVIYGLRRSAVWDFVQLWMSKVSNEFGTNYMRALSSLVIVGIILFGLYLPHPLESLEHTWEFWEWPKGIYYGVTNHFGDYFGFLNPIRHSSYLCPNNSMGYPDCGNQWALVIEWFSRIIVIYLLYQFYDAFRKYGKKRYKVSKRI